MYKNKVVQDLGLSQKNGYGYGYGGGCQNRRITSQRLLDQSQAGVYRRKCHIPPHFGPFWAYLRSLPRGVELLV